MNVVFRVDASLSIGNGHVMRCLSLAQVLRKQGAQCSFVCTAYVGNLNSLLAANGFDVLPLPVFPNESRTNAEELLSLWREDALATAQSISTCQPVDWLIVDHYGLDNQWEMELRSQVQHLMVIDDLANRTHACDMLLDPNPGRLAADYAMLVPALCPLLIGPSYALLREDFKSPHLKSLTSFAESDSIHVLISMGGVDKDNITADVLHALQTFNPETPLSLQVVLGPHAPWVDAVRSAANTLAWPTHVLQNPDNFTELMRQQHLAIGAAGGSALERCCLGLPAVNVVMAPNQRMSAQALQAAGACAMLELRSDWQHDLRVQLKLLLNAEKNQAMRMAGLQVTDGRGSERVSQELQHADIT